jgi:hypothetical protein
MAIWFCVKLPAVKRISVLFIGDTQKDALA